MACGSGEGTNEALGAIANPAMDAAWQIGQEESPRSEGCVGVCAPPPEASATDAGAPGAPCQCASVTTLCATKATSNKQTNAKLRDPRTAFRKFCSPNGLMKQSYTVRFRYRKRKRPTFL